MHTVEDQRLDDLAQRLRDRDQSGDSPAEPVPLPPELPEVPPFPLEALPDTMRPWVEDVAERMQCPADFVGVPLLVAASTLASRKAAIRLRQRDDWTEPGNLWAAIVGRPGAMKSPALRLALEPLQRLEARATQDFNDAMARHRAEGWAAKLRSEDAARRAKEVLRKDASAAVAGLLIEAEAGDPPSRRRYIVNSPTWQAAHLLLAVDASLLMCRDELAGWFAAMNREENAEGRSFFTSAWSGGSFSVDTVGRGSLTATDMRLSVIGAIQPGPLSQVIRQARTAGGDDGLIERFLFSWPDDSRAWRDVDRIPDTSAREAVFAAFDHLDTVTPEDLEAEQTTAPDGTPRGMPFLRLSDAAHDVFREWRGELEKRLRAPGGVAGTSESALAKFRHHIPALALVLHLSDGQTGRVGETAVLRALALADYFEGHGVRVFSSGRRATVQAAKAILGKLRTEALAPDFSARDIYRREWAGLADREVVADALDTLVVHGWLNELQVPTQGRPTLIYSLTEGARRGAVA